MAYDALCQFNASAGGTGSFTVASAVAGCYTPEQAGATNGKVYRYIAQLGSVWEWGEGAYSYSTHTLARTTISNTSASNTSPINFASAPVVVVFPAPSVSLEIPFPSGTNMLFVQSSAPLGWTKGTAYNDYALRLVNGTITAGGVLPFSTAFSYRTWDAATISTYQMPSHTHTEGEPQNNTLYPIIAQNVAFDSTSPTNVCDVPVNSGSTGNGGSHQHTGDMRVLYLDVIYATKN